MPARKKRHPPCPYCKSPHPEGTSCTLPEAERYVVGNAPDEQSPDFGRFMPGIVTYVHPFTTTEDAMATAAAMRKAGLKRVRVVPRPRKMAGHIYVVWREHVPSERSEEGT